MTIEGIDLARADNNETSETILRLHHDEPIPLPRLYTGVTGNLSRRVFEHKNKLVPGFTSRYNPTRLAYYECFFYPDAAIDREEEIKGWRRSKKIKLIESMNPRWDDLAERWSELYRPTAPDDPREIPRPA